MGDEVLEECMKERYGLAKERIREIITEETVKKPFGDFFRNRAKFLSMAADVMDESAAELTMEVLKERNHCFYQRNEASKIKRNDWWFFFRISARKI